MKKIIIAFVVGQGLQLIILAVALSLTYTENTMLFCAIGGGVAIAILGTGVALDRIELAVKENEMDETAPIPETIKVANDRIEKDPPSPPKTGSNADRSNVGKIKIAFEGEPSPLMAATLKEAEKDA